MKNRLTRTLFLVLFSIFIAIGIAEVSFHMFLPETYLLDWHSEEYWKAKLAEKMKKEKVDMTSSSKEIEKNIMYDPDLGWRMKLLYNSEGIQHNSKGFRGNKEYHIQSDETRIFAIGDSYTYGLGVADEYTFSTLIDQRSGIEVINENGMKLNSTLH